MRKTVDFIQEGFATVRKRLLTDLEVLSDEELHFIPDGGKYSPLDSLQHIAQAEEYWLIDTLIGEEGAVAENREVDATARKATLSEIKEMAALVRRHFNDYLEGLTDEDLLNEVCLKHSGEKVKIARVLYDLLEHECMYAGQILLIVRMCGKIPVSKSKIKRG